ncbi:MAG: cell envelope integrity protein TolA [Bacteroidales bacterium]|nr:cell envelope integrity protein TolA [Bacteroidales bacterium]
MKRRIFSLTVAIMALMLVSTGLSAQETPPPKSANEKQKQAEFQKQQALQEDLKLKQAELEAKRKEIQDKVADREERAAKRQREYEWVYRDFDDLDREVRDLTRNMPVVVVPDLPDVPDIRTYRSGSGNNIYIYGSSAFAGKPGSSWNYSRQVMEATFTNELTMSADEGENVNLTVSGDCAEGSIAVAIIMPDGKQLSEVILDENGSLNWRKSYEAGEGNGWKNGKWTFRIKAKNATGNLRISMNSY